MSRLRFAEHFAGISGFGLGFTRAGMTHTYAGELLPERQAVIRKHFPHVSIGGDINATSPIELGAPDVFAAGFPCDGTSIANVNRRGLADPRSAEFWSWVRLVEDTLRLLSALYPRWVVIENPDGLLRSPGKSKRGWDMCAVARGLDDLGYGWSYRVVDNQFLGTPQRRRRVILVGHLGGDPGPAEQVLADPGAGTQAPAPTRLRRGPRRGPDPVRLGRGGSAQQVLIWRKSANPRKALTLGGYETWVPAEYANTLTGFDWGNALRQKTLIQQGGRLRTLTITEWERLAGFPDGWTELGMSESQRADALGDSFPPGMAEWLGRRIIATDASLGVERERSTA